MTTATGDKSFPLLALPSDLIFHTCAFLSSGALFITSRRCHRAATQHCSLNYPEFHRLLEQLFRQIHPEAAQWERFSMSQLDSALIARIGLTLAKTYCIQSLYFHGLPRTRESVDIPLGQLFLHSPIRYLSLRHVPVNREQLELLIYSHHLTSLTLCRYLEIDTPFLATFSAHALSLTTLKLHNCPHVTDEGIACLELPHLTHLSLISCSAIKGTFLSNFSNLSILNLNFTRVDDHALKLVHGDNLLELHLGSCPVTDAGIRACHAPRLRFLRLFDTKVTFYGLSQHFPYLLDLDLSYCPISQEVIVEIATSCTLLRRWMLAGVGIKDISAFNSRHLQVLNIGTKWLNREEADILLRQCPKLQSIEVDPKKTPEAVLRRLPATKWEPVIG